MLVNLLYKKMLARRECLILGIFTIFIILSGVASQLPVESESPIYCYQCNSNLDRDCLNLQANDTHSFHYKPCLDTDKYNGSQPFCRKIIQKIMSRGNMELVIRKCGWVKHPRLDCYNFRNEDHMETICQCFSMGCNESASLSHSQSLLGALLLLLGYSAVRM